MQYSVDSPGFAIVILFMHAFVHWQQPACGLFRLCCHQSFQEINRVFVVQKRLSLDLLCPQQLLTKTIEIQCSH